MIILKSNFAKVHHQIDLMMITSITADNTIIRRSGNKYTFLIKIPRQRKMAVLAIMHHAY